MALDPLQVTSSDVGGPSTVVAALSVYVEPLVADARVAVVGDGELGFHTRLLELGARTVHLYDPDPERVARIVDEVPRGVSVRMLRDDFDVRDGAFDLVVIPDVGMLPNPSSAIVRLRRVVDPRGAVVAMGRARTAASDDTLFPELTPAVVEYAELYDLFALQFESVTMTGVLPFRGVVFAELGAGDDLTVSVDTRLVDPEPPGVFVVIAGREEDPVLDPYAIVQIERREVDHRVAEQERLLGLVGQVRTGPPRLRGDEQGPPRLRGDEKPPVGAAMRTADEAHEAAAAFAGMQLKAEMLAQQLDEHRARLSSGDQRAGELEGVLLTSRHALATVERRLATAEQEILDRDDQIASLNAELDESARGDQGPLASASIDPAAMAEYLGRVERAEAALAQHLAELAHVTEAHATETADIEAQLRERAGVIAAMEREIDRREQLVRELVASLAEAGDGTAAPHAFEAAPSLPGVAPEEVARLRRKLDELALEIARRDGELAAQTWRITELENENARLVASARPEAKSPPPAGDAPARAGDLERDLASARDELDALRQALTQEHAARVAAESGAPKSSSSVGC